MNSRECTFAALNHQQPDRPPLYVSLTPQLAEKLSEAVVSLLPTPFCPLTSQGNLCFMQEKRKYSKELKDKLKH